MANNLQLVGFNLPAPVIPEYYVTKYAVRFISDFIPGGVNPPPAAAPGKFTQKDTDFLWYVAMLPDTNKELFDNLLALKNDEQKLVDTLDEMFGNFAVV